MSSPNHPGPGPVHGAWARALGGSLVNSSNPSPIRGISPSRAGGISTQMHENMLVLMEGMGELQEQIKELQPLLALPDRVFELETRVREGEEREKELHNTLAVLTSLVSRITREDAVAQSALTRLTEEAQRLKILSERGSKPPKGGHGVVRTFSPVRR